MNAILYLYPEMEYDLMNKVAILPDTLCCLMLQLKEVKLSTI